MTAFAAAINALFADPNLAVAATLHRGDGSSAEVSIILRRPDVVSEFNAGRFRSETLLIDVRVSDVPILAEGDQFVIDAEVFRVAGAPVRDRERLVWAAEARRA
ncbi:MAG: hypothetical protein MUE98_00210 [Rhodobacteraceae bacterium]|jgi:hypothetical protein|nr:hypothetical protein [Paracoccaceae bacterium]